MLILTQIRTYHQTYTESEIYANGNFLCFALEDVGRPPNVKINADTCIPEGTYQVSLTHSNRFGREMTLLWNIGGSLTVNRDGKVFSGIRAHGGNTVGDTAGCPLVAHNSDGQGKVWGSAEKEVTDIVRMAIDNGEAVMWVISS